MEEKRIYVVVAGTVQVPASTLSHRFLDGRVEHVADLRKGVRTVIQLPGRQIAQACHVVSKLRNTMNSIVIGFEPITTIILQARDSAEERHIWALLVKKKLNPTYFEDTNPDVYGPGSVITALAVLATPYQVVGILDYLPLWGAQ